MTFNTGNPIGSTDARDLSDNAENFDKALGTLDATWTDRLGVTRDSFEGRLAKGSFYLVGDFTTGYTLTNMRQTLEYSGHEYSWAGTFPKVVAAGATPTTSGGIGAGAWVDRTDDTLRSELQADTGGDLVKTDDNTTVQQQLNYAGVVSTLSKAGSRLTNYKKATLINGETLTTPFSIPSYSELAGIGFAIGIIGSTYDAPKAITKSGNATVTLSNQDASAGSATVDCVMYINPAWPNSTVYPQKTTIRGIGIVGNSASHNQAGIYILQGGGYTIDSVDVVNCVNGLWSKNSWLMDIRKLHTLGKIRCDGGTSWNLTDCWAQGDTSRVGAFDFTNLLYSTLNGCGSDGAVNSAYAFNWCEGVTLNGCGCEAATTITANSGTALAIGDGNTITINGFTCVPVADQGVALITVGTNNKVEIHGWDSAFGIAYETDIYVYGNGSVVEIWESKFKTRLPVVQIAVGSTSRVILHAESGNTYIYTAPTVAGPAVAEAFFDSGTWTPTLTFGGGSTGLTYSVQSGTWEKNGNQAILHFKIKLSALGSSTGKATITGCPFISKGEEALTFAYLYGITGGPLQGIIDAGGTSIIIDKISATGNVNATQANFSNDTFLWGTLRIGIKDSKFS